MHDAERGSVLRAEEGVVAIGAHDVLLYLHARPGSRHIASVVILAVGVEDVLLYLYARPEIATSTHPPAEDSTAAARWQVPYDL